MLANASLDVSLHDAGGKITLVNFNNNLLSLKSHRYYKNKWFKFNIYLGFYAGVLQENVVTCLLKFPAYFSQTIIQISLRFNYP